MPYYERDRRLQTGDTARIGVGPNKTTVEVWGDTLALVTPPEDREVCVGEAKIVKREYSKRWAFKSRPEYVSGWFVLDRRSVSTHVRYPQIVWKKE